MLSVLVADDSIFMRKRISKILESDRRLQVVGTARNGIEVLKKIEELKPDVVTLDVEMPIMNGLQALEKIVEKFTIPVVMLSSLTHEGADVTIKALELGATDFIPKPRGNGESELKEFNRDLILKVRGAAFAKRSKQRSMTNKKTGDSSARKTFVSKNIIVPGRQAVAIGISTGGPKTLLDVIPKIPSGFPCPIFIAQHMPEGFTRSLAERLDSLSNIKVREAQNGEVVENSTCYVAPGGMHMRVRYMTLSKGVMIRIGTDPKGALYKPSVDELLYSVSEVYGSNAVGVIMTGMGRDGTKGMREIKEKGGITVSEDKSTCIVYGMPKSVQEAGLSEYVLPSGEIPEFLTSIFSRGGHE